MQRITWDEFSFYLIGKATALSRKVLTNPEHAIKTYSLAPDIRLSARPNELFTRLAVLPSLNRIALVTDKSDELRFFSLKSAT